MGPPLAPSAALAAGCRVEPERGDAPTEGALGLRVLGHRSGLVGLEGRNMAAMIGAARPAAAPILAARLKVVAGRVQPPAPLRHTSA